MCEVITRIDFTYHSLHITLCRPYKLKLSRLYQLGVIILHICISHSTASYIYLYNFILSRFLYNYHTMYRHDIAEILLKVALNTKNQSIIQCRLYFFVIFLLTCILHIFN